MEINKTHFLLDRAHLEEAVLKQASIFEYYASEAARQESKVARLKNELKYKSAQRKIEIRANAAATKAKLLLDEVECMIATDPELHGLELQILDTEEYLGQLKSAVEAMRHKRDSIENERALVLSKFTLINGDCSSDTKLEMQTNAVEEAINKSMNK